MVNHLCWNGVEEAQRLLQRLTSSRAQDGFDDNQPTARISLPDLMAMAEEAFHIASAHMEEDEILLKVQKWIKDDKAAFLLDALESPATTIPSLQSALQRFAQVGTWTGSLSVDGTEIERALRQRASEKILVLDNRSVYSFKSIRLGWPLIWNSCPDSVSGTAARSNALLPSTFTVPSSRRP